MTGKSLNVAALTIVANECSIAVWCIVAARIKAINIFVQSLREVYDIIIIIDYETKLTFFGPVVCFIAM